MIYWVHVAATLVMRVVPVRVVYRVVGWAMPLALQMFARGHLNRATDNMRQVLGPHVDPREARRVTRAAFANYARYMVDLVRMPNLKPREFIDSIAVEGWENVDTAYAYGKGVVFATGHIGNWDMAGATFAARGRPVSALVETLKPARWNERVQRTRIGRGREGHSDRVWPAGHARRAAQARGPGGAGRPASGAGRCRRDLLRASHAHPGRCGDTRAADRSPVVPAALVRNPHGRGYLALIGAPIVGVKGDDASMIMQRVMSWLEGIIRRYPDQWFMFRQMWPAGEPLL